MKRIILSLQIQCGEYQFTQKVLVSVNEKLTDKGVCGALFRIAGCWYADQHRKRESDVWYFFNGELAVRISSWQPLFLSISIIFSKNSLLLYNNRHHEKIQMPVQ